MIIYVLYTICVYLSALFIRVSLYNSSDYKNQYIDTSKCNLLSINFQVSRISIFMQMKINTMHYAVTSVLCPRIYNIAHRTLIF